MIRSFTPSRFSQQLIELALDPEDEQAEILWTGDETLQQFFIGRRRGQVERHLEDRNASESSQEAIHPQCLDLHSRRVHPDLPQSKIHTNEVSQSLKLAESSTNISKPVTKVLDSASINNRQTLAHTTSSAHTCTQNSEIVNVS